MAAPKNHAKAGGRKKGTPNKVTQDLKEFYVALMDDNREKIQWALDTIEDPYQYLMAIDKISQKVIANKRDITSDDQSIVPHVTIIERRNSTESETDRSD